MLRRICQFWWIIIDEDLENIVQTEELAFSLSLNISCYYSVLVLYKKGLLLDAPTIHLIRITFIHRLHFLKLKKTSVQILYKTWHTVNWNIHFINCHKLLLKFKAKMSFFKSKSIWFPIKSNFFHKSLDPFLAYASVIDSISTYRFVYYRWNAQEKRCEFPSNTQAFLYYAQVFNQALFTLATVMSFGLYLFQDDFRNSVFISDILFLIGLFYGIAYQLSSIRYGQDVMLHINQQVLLNEKFCKSHNFKPNQNIMT